MRYGKLVCYVIRINKETERISYTWLLASAACLAKGIPD